MQSAERKFFDEAPDTSDRPYEIAGSPRNTGKPPCAASCSQTHPLQRKFGYCFRLHRVTVLFTVSQLTTIPFEAPFGRVRLQAPPEPLRVHSVMTIQPGTGKPTRNLTSARDAIDSIGGTP